MQMRPKVVVHALGYRRMTFPSTKSPKVKYPEMPTAMNKAEVQVMAKLDKVLRDDKDLSAASLIMENIF